MRGAQEGRLFRELRKQISFSAGLLLSISAVCRVDAQFVAKDYSVPANARVQTSPPSIELVWPAHASATEYIVSRKPLEGASWQQMGTLPGDATNFIDTGVLIGSAYEYQLVKQTSQGYTGYGYVAAGIEVALEDTRGKVLLIVENRYAPDLALELRRLELDLAGDGWTVVRRDVTWSMSTVEVKARIAQEYSADPANLRAVFLFGNVPVPYSGDTAPDAHLDHVGAWPADVYYGEMNGNWTDSEVTSTNASRQANWNVPGDGKFDQSIIPTSVELAVGRVDLWRMTAFSNKALARSEKDLLRQYLNKDHAFRHGRVPVPRRALVVDLLGMRGAEPVAASGWRNFGGFFGAENISTYYWNDFFPRLNQSGYLWSYGCGGGSFYYCAGIGSSDDIAVTDLQVVFTMFLGSYFGDWHNESNFLRAMLGSRTHVLTASYAGYPHHLYHPMALGKPIGQGLLLTQNNDYGGLYPFHHRGTRSIHISLLGDPTLRMHPVIPPSTLRGIRDAGRMTLTWDPSTDTGIQGYHVYSAGSYRGPFTRLTGDTPLVETSYTHTGSQSEDIYMVRAVKLDSSASGTYFNSSQGIFFPDPFSEPATSLPNAPAGIEARNLSPGIVELQWVDNSGNEEGFSIERRTGETGIFLPIATAGMDTSKFQDTEVLADTLYTYRIRATNAAGLSPPTEEVALVTQPPDERRPPTAVLAGVDAATRGNWKGVYGTDGYSIIGSTSALPGFLGLSVSDGTTLTWIESTSDIRALQPATGSERMVGLWSSQRHFDVILDFLDNRMHRVAFYCLDWDRIDRSQTIDFFDANTGVILSSYTLSDFGDGKYLVYDLAGRVQVRFKRSESTMAMLMGLFIGTEPAVAPPSITPNGGYFEDPVSVRLQSPTPGATIRYTVNGTTPTQGSALYSGPFGLSGTGLVKSRAFHPILPPSEIAVAHFSGANVSIGPATAKFAGKDSNTGGTWTPSYGTDGYRVFGGQAQLPSYALLAGISHSEFTWADPTPETRALLKSSSAPNRVAACWYSGDPFSLEVTLRDADMHRVSLYFLDWDRRDRQQKIEVLDPVSGTVLDTQTISQFADGVYLSWHVSGKVRFRITPLVHNAVVMGIFFASDSPVAQPVISPGGGSFESSTLVSLDVETPGAEIRYTLDGTPPDPTSFPYTEPFLLSRSATLQARGFREGRAPSSIATAEFVIIPEAHPIVRMVVPEWAPEGGLIDAGLDLELPEEISAVEFVLRFNPELISPAIFNWPPEIFSSDRILNVTPGELDVYLEFEPAVPSGTYRILEIQFRASHVAFPRDAELTIAELKSRVEGDERSHAGTELPPAIVSIMPRQLTGDNNANNRLDLADAVHIHQLVDRPAAPEDWQIAANDVNADNLLNLADVEAVLHVVTDLQSHEQSQQAVSGPARFVILPAELEAGPGETVTVQITAADFPNPIKAGTFLLEYPSAVLRLADATSHQPGPLLSEDYVAGWNIAPDRTNYLSQSGQAGFAFCSSVPIPNGVVAKFTFHVQQPPGPGEGWNLTVGAGRCTSDGYLVEPVLGSQAVFVFEARPAPVLRIVPGDSENTFIFHLSGHAGSSFRIEGSTDLVEWTEVPAESDPEDSSVVSASTQGMQRFQFFRARLLD
jgi:hypothetical protein